MAKTLTVKEQREQLMATALDKLQRYFDGDVNGDEAGVAMKATNMLAKLESTETNRLAIQFAILQVVCPKPAKLAEAARAISPGLKALVAS